MKMTVKAFVLCFLAAVALDARADDEVVRWYDAAQKVTWGYTLENGEATISTPYFWDSNMRDNCTGDIVVPSRVGPDGPNGAKTYPVRDMAPGLFRNCTKVTSVTLPDGIRRIAPNAFYFDRNSTITNVAIGAGCLDICENAFLRCENLVSLNIPNSVTNIGANAIQLCKALPRIDIPGSVKTIGDSAFAACYDLADVTFGDGIEIIDADAFMNCSSLLAVDLPASVRSIGDRAFYGCSQLASATLREGLEAIGFCAFNQCSSLTSVSVPSSVTWVGERAFQFCQDTIFDKTTVSGVCLLSGWAVGVDNPFGAIDLVGVNGVADGLFKDCRNVTSVVLPPGIETLGGSMFSGCRSLESVSLPVALKSIESYAFQGCQKIQTLNIPSGVTNIGQLAFGYCEKLSAVALPDGLAAMGDNAFDGCTNLTSVTIPASLKRIPMGAFENCTSLTNVTVEEGVEIIGNASFYGCGALSAFAIPASVKVVEDIAFGGCAFLDTNTIANVSMVDGWIVGSDQEKLTEVTVPGGVRGIADEAFSYRRNLTNAVVEAGVRRIPDRCFNCSTRLADVSLPDTLEEIDDFAFYNTALVEAWAPSNVVAFGEKAFGGCKTLETVYLPLLLKGKVNETDLVDGSFSAKIRYYRADGTIDDTCRVTFDPNGGELDAAEATRDVKAGTSVGALPTPTRKKYRFVGWFAPSGDKISSATKIEEDVAFSAEWEEDPGWIVLELDAEYAAAADGSFALALGECVESASAPKFTVKGLPSGIRYYANSLSIYGRATKPGTYAVTVSATNAKAKKPATATFGLVVPNLTSDVLPGLLPEADAYGAVQCGVAFNPSLVDCTPEEGWTVKAAGLPAGLKLVQDKATGAYLITGVPTKAGTNTVTFTATKKDEVSQVATITLATAALPAWAQGTFSGFVRAYGGEPDYQDGYGSATMTVAANGKTSGKIALLGTNWTFTAASYAACDGGDYFEVSADARAGKATMPLWLLVRRMDEGLSAGRLLNGSASGWLGGSSVASVELRRGVWKDKSTAAEAKAGIAGWEGLYTLSALDGGYLSLTVGKDGNVKAAGKLADGTGVSAASPLMYDGEEGAFAYVYAAPAAYKGGALSVAVGFDDARLVSRFGISRWTSLNPQAMGVYGEGFDRELDFVGARYDKTRRLNEFFGAVRLDFESLPALAFSRKVTYFDENNRKKTVAEPAEAYAQNTQDDVWASVNEKGAFVVQKATKPVQDKSTKEWSYAGPNDGAATLSFAQATGIFKGSYTLWYDYASAVDETAGKSTSAHMSKKVSFEGVAVQGEAEMRGFFLWDATGSYEDPKTGKTKTYKYKESRFAVLVAP